MHEDFAELRGRILDYFDTVTDEQLAIDVELAGGVACTGEAPALQ